MKPVYLLGGTMGVGKTTVGRNLQKLLPNCAFLDGDWCWDARPFVVNGETKKMVMENIRFLLGQFIRCTAFDSVVFCWVMHEQGIIDDILSGIPTDGCRIVSVSLTCSEETLRERLSRDIAARRRTSDVVARSVSRLPLYEALDTVKLDTDGQSAACVAERILAL